MPDLRKAAYVTDALDAGFPQLLDVHVNS